MSVLNHILSEKKHFLESCDQCGKCAKNCPILKHTDIKEMSSRDIQAAVFEFIENGVASLAAYTKAFACMECFKCTQDMCPKDLNPLLINELIKDAYISRGLAPKPVGDAREPDSAHRILTSILVPESDTLRITTASKKRTARYVFFPGCNVYFQPEKILNSLDIMDKIGDDYVFLPGIDHCCGDSGLFGGDIRGGSEQANELMTAISAYQPEAVILWCPTCQCRFDKYIIPAMGTGFKVIPFATYLADHMDTLSLTDKTAGPVTLHEPCKSAYTGLDTNGARRVLQQLPGVILKEMARHGKKTSCCGSGAYSWFPDSGEQIRRSRMDEAAQTGVEKLVTVCHYCSDAFLNKQKDYDFDIINYIDLVARAAGIDREDTFKKYRIWRDLELIMADAADRISASPFKKERIIEVLEAVFVK